MLVMFEQRELAWGWAAWSRRGVWNLSRRGVWNLSGQEELRLDTGLGPDVGALALVFIKKGPTKGSRTIMSM
jgi:hypothetical protein